MNSLSYVVPAAIFLILGLSPEVATTLILLCFGYAGILTHYVKKWANAVEKDEPFSLKKTTPSIILSFITTTVLIILRADIENFFVFTKFGSFIVGYFGSSWFFEFVEKKMNYKNENENEN